MVKFDGLPDLPANWLELLQAETIVIQRNMPADPQEAQAKAHQDIMAEIKKLEEKCPRIYQFMQVSNETLRSSLA